MKVYIDEKQFATAFFAVFLLQVPLAKIKNPTSRIIYATPIALVYLFTAVFFTVSHPFWDWLLAAAGTLFCMKVFDLALTPYHETRHWSLVELWCFINGFVKDPKRSFNIITTDPSTKWEIRKGGLVKLTRLFVKYAALWLVICPNLVSPKTIQQSTPLVQSLHYYLYGWFLYLVVSCLGDFGFGFYQLVFSIEMNDLFDSPFLATSPRDFWSQRWNRLFSHLFRRLIFRFRKDNPMNSSWFAIKVFFVSGAIHEWINLVTWGVLNGNQMVFFLSTGFATVVQVYLRQLCQTYKGLGDVLFSNTTFARVIYTLLNTLFFALLAPYFFGDYIKSSFFTENAFDFIGLKFHWIS